MPVSSKHRKSFVNLKSNSALLYNKGHNLLTSAFPPKNVRLIKFPLKSFYRPHCLPPTAGGQAGNKEQDIQTDRQTNRALNSRRKA